MKYNFYRLLQSIKKQYILLFVVYIFFYFMFMLYMAVLPTNLSLFTILIGLPPYQEGIKILWTLFQVCCHIYITYTFFTNEKEHSFEFLLLRKSYKKNFIHLLVVVSIFTMVIRSFIFIFSYFFLFRDIPFSISLFLFNSLLYLVVSVITSFFVLLQSKKAKS